jgi:serine protease Do
MMNTEKNKRKRFLSFFLTFFIGVFALSVVSVMGISYLSLGTSTERAIAASTEETVATPLSFADLAERLKPSVVNIRTTKTITTGRRGAPRSPFGEGTPFDKFFGDEFFKRFFGDVPQREFKQRSLGSGFIISKDGYIFTNYHVVERADKILVKLSDGKEYEATIVGKDKNTDIALLKIKPVNSLPVAVLGDSAKLRVGDWVIAIGNPFGLTQTVTAGIVSAKGRVIGAGPYDDFIQTDASINPGNSGGPLFNLAGEVVGINTAIVAQGQGIGFAIPIHMANQILPDLKTKGKVVRGWLGVSIQDITEDIAKSLKLKTQEGVLIADVFKGDPADKAGLQTGDIIVALNGKTVKDTHELLMIVAGIKVGETVKVTIMRNATEKVFKVRIAERPEREQLAKREKSGEFFGMTVQEITPEIADHLKLPDTKGVIVSEVQQGGPADQAGIQPGDIILQVNRNKIQSLKEYTREMSKTDEEESVLLSIRRKDAKFFVVIRK